MTKKERLIMSTVLLLVSILTTFDLLTDLKEGVEWWHVIIEGGIALIALFGVYYLLKGTFRLQKSLKKERELSSKLLEESSHWKESSKRFLDGLSQSIDLQLEK